MCGFISDNLWECTTYGIRVSSSTPVVCCSGAEANSEYPLAKSTPSFSSSCPVPCLGCHSVTSSGGCSRTTGCNAKNLQVFRARKGCKYRSPFRAGDTIEWSRVILYKDLLNKTRELLPDLAGVRATGIIGMPRSGMLPASIIAMELALPLLAYDRTTKSIYNIGEGRRRGLLDGSKREKYILVDDSVCSGEQMLSAIKALSEVLGHKKTVTCSIFANPGAKYTPHIVGARYSPPHFFEWNVFQNFMTEKIAFDMDGIICADPPPIAWSEGKEYEEWIRNPQLLHVPITKNGVVVISARSERFRRETEDWLNAAGIKVKALILCNNSLVKTPENVGKWKAEKILQARIEHGISYYMESSYLISREISSRVGIPVICWEDKTVLMGGHTATRPEAAVPSGRI